MSNPKELRKQIRNVIQDLAPDLASAEVVAVVERRLNDSQKEQSAALESLLTARLDRIEKFCQDSLKKSDERARAVQSFLVQGAAKDINEYQANTHITMLAWQEIMAEKIGDVEELNKAIDERKKTIAQRLRAEAEARMAARVNPKLDNASPEPQPVESEKPSESGSEAAPE